MKTHRGYIINALHVQPEGCVMLELYWPLLSITRGCWKSAQLLFSKTPRGYKMGGRAFQNATALKISKYTWDSIIVIHVQPRSSLITISQVK